MARLLIVACSQRKNPGPGTLRAIDRYDGPVFRVLRKFLREQPPDPPSIYVLSAHYGLIAAETEIPDYDCRLTVRSAEGIRPQVIQSASYAIASRSWDCIGICAGSAYRVALAGFEGIAPPGMRVQYIEGGQGVRLAALRKWLRQ